MTEHKPYFRKPINEVKESHLKCKVKEICNAHGAWYGMPVAGPWGRGGLPDFVIIRPSDGKFIGVETKTMVGKVSELQRMCLDAIRRGGGLALVIRPDNLWELEELLRRL